MLDLELRPLGRATVPVLVRNCNGNTYQGRRSGCRIPEPTHKIRALNLPPLIDQVVTPNLAVFMIRVVEGLRFTCLPQRSYCLAAAGVLEIVQHTIIERFLSASYGAPN